LREFSRNDHDWCRVQMEVRLKIPAPEGRQKVAGGKRSAAPGSNGLKRSPGRGEGCALFRPMAFCHPCQASKARLPPATPLQGKAIESHFYLHPLVSQALRQIRSAPYNVGFENFACFGWQFRATADTILLVFAGVFFRAGTHKPCRLIWRACFRFGESCTSP
jgi:hypothetical protein